MLIQATQRYTRYSPQKTRLVANAVKSLPLAQAVDQLALRHEQSSEVILKTLRQAIANATNNLGIAVSNLEIDSITVNQGPTYKRFRAVSRGRAHGIEKKTCHVCVTLKTKEEVEEKVVKAAKSQSSKVTKSTSSVKTPEAKKTDKKVETKTVRAPKTERVNVKKGGAAKVVAPRTTSK